MTLKRNAGSMITTGICKSCTMNKCLKLGGSTEKNTVN